ncbi:MAG: hypothetical protein ACRDV4_07935, partial [Acidimicrobiales bacterium]
SSSSGTRSSSTGSPGDPLHQPGGVRLARREVTGIEAAVLAKAARIDLGDSALHAPSASFGGEEFYSDIIDSSSSSIVDTSSPPTASGRGVTD